MTSRRDHSRTVFAVVGLLFLLRLLGAKWRQGFPVQFPDSATFLDAARLGPFSADFWLNDRPTGIPLVLWLVRSNVRAFILLQSLVYVGAVAHLCRTILRAFTSRGLAWLTCALVAALCMQTRFALWNLEVLSESLSLSAVILGVSFVIRIARNPERDDVRSLTACILAILLMRDASMVLGVIALVVFVVVTRLVRDPRMRRTLVRCTVAILVMLAYVTWAQADSQRYQYATINNVGLRILPDPAMTADFVSRGMPMSDELLARSGKSAWDDGSAFLVGPGLEEFRTWVHSGARTDQLVSFVRDIGFWQRIGSRDATSALSYDFVGYSRFGLSDRLPGNMGILGGPATSGQYWALFSLTVLAGLAMVRNRSTRRTGAVLVIMLASSAAYFASSLFADAIEVQRHSIGPMCMSILLFFLVIGFAIDSLRAGPGTPAPAERVQTPWPDALSTAMGLVLFLVSWVVLEFRSQDWDPGFARTIIERAARFGGTYYQNGIWHHGPLDAVLYDIPRLVTGYGTYWFGISALVIAIAVSLACSLVAVARQNGAGLSVVAMIVPVASLHFAISSSDYAGVIYSRNVTTLLLAVVLAVCATPSRWSTALRANAAYLGSMVALGLAVQTMISSVLTAVVLFVIVHAWHRADVSLRRPWLLGPATVAASVATAPAWYALRGSFGEFWANWWTMANFMSGAFHRSILEQLDLGRHKLWAYYADRPVLVAIIVLFFVISWRLSPRMSRGQRILHAGLVFWLVAAWLEMAFSQRYSSHYFIIPTVPTAFMTVLLFTHLAGAPVLRKVFVADRARRAPVLLVVIVLLVTQCHDLFWGGVEGAARFRSFAAHEQFVRDNRSNETKTIRAVLDLVSRDNDGLLSWTMFPWTYLGYQRVPATRLSWKSFMLGEIYLAGTSEEYVLADTWKWFDADMKQAQPAAYLHPDVVNYVEDTPFARYVTANFGPSLKTATHRLSIRSSLWREMTSPVVQGGPATTMDIPDSGSPQSITSGACTRIDATLTRADDAMAATVHFALLQHSDASGTREMSLDAGKAWSSVNGNETDSRGIVVPDTSAIPVSIIIGTRSAMMIVNGAIATAIELPGPAGVTVTSKSGSVQLRDVRTSGTPYLPGCGAD